MPDKVTLADLRPTSRCPKCDSLDWDEKPSWQEPRYDAAETLAWFCRTCGYAEMTKTVEQANR